MKSNDSKSVQRFQKGRLFCDRYEIIRCIGYGSVGEIYEVKDRELDDQTVAIKFLHNFLREDTATLQRFQNEVFISRQLAHPNIARVYDFASADGIYFITLEYVSGCNLSEVAASYASRSLPEKDALYLLLQIAEGLACAHQKNVIHRDLKPHNIIVESSGLAKISDFGLAFSIETDHGLTRTGEMIGSPAYLAPEQFSKSVADPRADVYAFGILAFELLTGDIPFDSKSYYELAKLHEKAEFPRHTLEAQGISEPLISIIERCCEKSPDKRPEDASALLKLLTGLGADPKSNNLRLKTIVSQKRQDSRITTGKEARSVQFWLMAVMLLILYFVFSEPSVRRRVAESLVQIERHTGLPTAHLHKYMFYSSSDFSDINELLRLASSEVRWGGNGDVRIFLESGINLMERIPDGTNDTVMHKLMGDLTAKSAPILEHAKLNNLLNQRNNKGETPLMRAVQLGDAMSISYLLRGTVRLQRLWEIEKGYREHTNEHSIFLETPDAFYNKLLGSLVHGADQRIADRDGNYPLHVAISAGDIGIVRILTNPENISPKLPPTARGPRGYTALHLAVILEHEDIAKHLIEQGYDIDLRDETGRTPLMVALSGKPTAKNKHLVELLLSWGASPRARDDQGRNAMDHAILHRRADELS